jgi:LPS export ABC transporter protein LptC/lipopolysaccharide transport protein LptA
MRKKTFLSIIIFSLAFISLYFAYFKIKNMLSRSEVSFIAKMMEKNKPNMTIDSFTLQETEGSSLDWTLNADKAHMFKNKEQIVFESVKTIIFSKETKKEEYNINSKKGLYNMKEDKISLDEDVLIKTATGYDFLTDKVSYMVKEKRLDSKSNVSVKGKLGKQGSIKINGKGLNGDLYSGDFGIDTDVFASVGKQFRIESESAIFNTNTSKARFIKKVSALKEDLKIKGDELELQYTSGGEIEEIIVSRNVRLNIDKKKALCEKAVISSQENMVVLTGRPELHLGRDIMVGERIVFFTDSDEVHVEKAKGDVQQGRSKK